MDIAKQIIDQRVNKLSEENAGLFTDSDAEKKRSKAFLLLGVAAYLDIDVAEAALYMAEIDGRTMAAVFRRFDIIEQYIKNPA
jgi:hypothetical protein